MIVPAHLFQQLLPAKQPRKCDSATTDLRAELSRALKAKRFEQALDVYELIEKRKPEEPRWAHRKGDLLRRMGRSADAVLAYERAVQLYSEKGFDARAAATARLVLRIDSSKGALLDRVEARAARRAERQSRGAFELNY